MKQFSPEQQQEFTESREKTMADAEFVAEVKKTLGQGNLSAMDILHGQANTININKERDEMLNEVREYPDALQSAPPRTPKRQRSRS